MGTNYTIVYSPVVIRDDIPALGSVERKRIQHEIEEKLMRSPEIFGKPLRQSLKGHRSLRVGQYRIVFRIADSTVIIFAIVHRSSVYQEAKNRI